MMALLQNISINAQNPISLSGAAGANERSQFGLRLQTWPNKYMGHENLGWDYDAPVPPAEIPPYAWFMSLTAPTIAGITASPQALIELTIQAYPVTVVLGDVPRTSADTTIGKIAITAIAPRIVFTAIAPRISFEGDE